MIRQVQGPCGNVLRFRGTAGKLECPKCGVTLKIVASASTTPATQNPGPGTTKAMRPPAASQARQATTRPNTSNRLPPAKTPPSNASRPSRRTTGRTTGRKPSPTLMIMAIGGGLLVAGVVAVLIVWRLGMGRNDGAMSGSSAEAAADRTDPFAAGPTLTSESTSQSGGLGPASGQVRIATYPDGPRIDATTEFLDRELAEVLKPLLDLSLHAIPPEQNAAPLYLEALAELNAEVADLIPPGIGVSAAARRELAQQTADRIDGWYRAFDPGDVPFPSPAELLAFDPLVARLLNAQQERPDCSFLTVLEVSDLAPHLQAVRSYSKLIKLRLAVLGPQRPNAESIREYESLLRLIDECSWGNILCGLVALAAEGELHEIALPVFLTERTTADELRHLQQILERHDARLGIARLQANLASDRIMFEQLLRIGQGKDAVERIKTTAEIVLQVRPDNNSVAEGTALFTSAMMAMTPQDIQRGSSVWAEMDQEINRAIEAAGPDCFAALPIFDQMEQQTLADLDQRLRRAGQVSHETIGEVLVGLLRAGSKRIYTSYTWRIAQRRIAYTQYALHAWQRTHSERPTSIELIVKDKPSAIDPYCGERLRLVWRGDQPIVYSVGPNRIDDQANTLAELTYEGPGDVSFLFPSGHDSRNTQQAFSETPLGSSIKARRRDHLSALPIRSRHGER